MPPDIEPVGLPCSLPFSEPPLALGRPTPYDCIGWYIACTGYIACWGWPLGAMGMGMGMGCMGIGVICCALPTN